jgi:diaminohydroxyphosphoribosylaminopyrimidine deaminase/5-amino-6-(5-phosphoribosylamino)uracil reductase
MLHAPDDVYRLHDVNDLLVEGGSATATAFLAADLVDRILIYRAPILIGDGKSSVGTIGLHALADAHGRWRPADGRALGRRPARSLRAGAVSRRFDTCRPNS